jgi:hypothetical protein
LEGRAEDFQVLIDLMASIVVMPGLLSMNYWMVLQIFQEWATTKLDFHLSEKTERNIHLFYSKVESSRSREVKSHFS